MESSVTQCLLAMRSITSDNSYLVPDKSRRQQVTARFAYPRAFYTVSQVRHHLRKCKTRFELGSAEKSFLEQSTVHVKLSTSFSSVQFSSVTAFMFHAILQ